MLSRLGDEYPFEPRTLDVGGANLSYVDEGPRDARPVLFVHGNPSWSYLWRKPIRELATTRRCIAPDHVGMGLSDKPEHYEYRLARHIENLTRLVRELDLERITLVVHDWGGPIGLGALAAERARFERLVLTNTACFTGLAAPWRIRLCRTPLFGALAVRGFNAFAGAATTMAVEKPLSDVVKRGFLAPYHDWKSRVAVLRFVEDIPMSANDPSWSTLVELERELPRLAALPTAILWGERDFCFTPTFREEWERRLPHAVVKRFEFAGHYLFEDAASEATAALKRFLEGVTP
ncbi:MAG: alpha/beta fold hydrolase [Planctomycetes bacterium]|nr:alpha/beta fold hydrolase [Planctomycetota bacterium]